MASQIFSVWCLLALLAIRSWSRAFVPSSTPNAATAPPTEPMPSRPPAVQQPTVCAPSAGCMQGVRLPGYQSDQYEAFLGIPYALPPLNELRFSNPKTFPKWRGVLDATAPKADCIQKNYLVPDPQVSGSEDCLYLNVYRPMALRDREKLPVMVYIFGGGWFSGSSHPALHGPEYLMDAQEVIVVTFAYRLGPLGFLSTRDAHMPGNFGLKDQNLALRWVQKNIAAFGGNSRLVTVFGQSAGAVSVHLHMLSRQSAGLFRHAISMSGTANVQFAITEDPLAQTRRIAELCNISDAAELGGAKLTRALRRIDAVQLVNAGDGLKYWNVDHLTNFRPVVEHRGDGDAFLTQHPRAIMASGRYKRVPWLVGGVPDEGAVRALAILANQSLRADFNANFDELFEQMMELPPSDEGPAKVRRILEEYFQGQRELSNGTAQAFLDTISDRGFKQPYFNAIKAFVEGADADQHPVYLYQFNYTGPYSYASIYTGRPPGASPVHAAVHCDDLIYLFRSPALFPDFAKDSVHAAMAAQFVGDFVHFAKHGYPRDPHSLRECSRRTFERQPICDYRLYTNERNATHESFATKTDNAFNTRRVRFWNEILA